MPWAGAVKQELAATMRPSRFPVGAIQPVNHIVHRSNNRLEHDLALCEKHKGRITSPRSAHARTQSGRASLGGIVFHDVSTKNRAQGDREGADGLILVSAVPRPCGVNLAICLRAETRQGSKDDRAFGRHRNGRAIRAARRLGATSPISAPAFIATCEPTRWRAISR